MMKSPSKKLGVIWHSDELYFHYQAILKHLDPSFYEIVLLKESSDTLALMERVGYGYTSVEACFESGYKYPFTLSNHFISAWPDPTQTGTVFLPQVLGHFHIRLMYSLGKDYWNYDFWNSIYDVHLCFGPWQAERLASFKSQVFPVGYPRYDSYFNQVLDIAMIREKLHLNTEKPVLLWLPTRGEHAIPYFSQALAALSSEYQIILKPHPFTLKEEPELLVSLKKAGFHRVIDFPIDNLELFAVADYVLCDYGGPAFGAIYLDKPLILLNQIDNYSYEDGKPITEKCETESYLRKFIPSLFPRQANCLRDLLMHSQTWTEQKKVRQILRETFFSPYYGSAGKQAAFILKNIERLKPPSDLTEELFKAAQQ